MGSNKKQSALTYTIELESVIGFTIGLKFFLEMMKLPRVESKLRVFSFKIQFGSQVSELRTSLSIVKYASEEVRESFKLRRIMQTILSLGNALNQGTARADMFAADLGYDSSRSF
eukprot:Gb_24688 [translate_table: standard]